MSPHIAAWPTCERLVQAPFTRNCIEPAAMLSTIPKALAQLSGFSLNRRAAVAAEAR